MRVILLTILISAFALKSNKSFSQTYTTNSKSCGACGRAVSNNSTVGMSCPYCGARWGRENTTHSTSYSNNDYNYPSYSSDNWHNNYSKTSGITSSKANIRERPSTKGTVKTTIPAYTTVEIILESGNWYYVKYPFWNGYEMQDNYGYVSKSLVN